MCTSLGEWQRLLPRRRTSDNIAEFVHHFFLYVYVLDSFVTN